MAIKSVIFVEDASKKKTKEIYSNKFEVEKPKNVGKIVIPEKKSKIQADSSKIIAKPYKKFPISQWKTCLDVAFSANKVLGYGTVTLSKKQKDKKENESHTEFTVYYTCDSRKMVDNYIKPLEIRLAEDSIGIPVRRINKRELRIMNIEAGVEFYVFFIGRDKTYVDVISSIKVSGEAFEDKYGKNGFYYIVSGEPKDVIYWFSWTDVTDDGRSTFVNSDNEVEDVLFYIPSHIENM